MREPLVTVGLQFFNAQDTLAASIRSLLDQTYSNWELILHNDGSTDRSVEIAMSFRDPRLRLMGDGTRKKRAARINESLLGAHGEYYALADADDISYPERLAAQVEYLESHAEVDLLGTGMLIFDNDGNALGKRQPPTTHKQICHRPWAGFAMAQPTFMGRLEWFRSHLYNVAKPRVEDQDLLLRSYRASCFANLPEILVAYREDRLTARKLLTERWHLWQSLAREFLMHRRPDMLVRAAFEQAAKAALDATAVASGQGYRVLRHRARPICELERQEWANLWRRICATDCHE